MSTAPSSAAESTDNPHALFILPALTPPRQDDLTLLVLTDGNTRASSSGGGYASGARRVVSIAEHLARRSDVAAMVACILSPDNVAKRGERFFAALYQEFVELGVAVESQRTLVSASVRMELHGDLGPLRARGGWAAALSDAIEVVVSTTASVQAPRLRLVLGVGYGPDTVRELGVDIVLRTGMEEPGVLRLSGLSTGEGVANVAITTLWPDVEPREVDEVLSLCKGRASPRLASGHGAGSVAELACALAKEEPAAPVLVTLPTCAPPTEVAAVLERLYEGTLRGSRTLTVEYAADRRAAPVRYGPERGARHQLRVVGGTPAGCAPDAGVLASVIAPGQAPPLFRIPEGFPLGHANVHACAATVEGMMEGIRAALRFTSAHPPLCGRDRASGCTAEPRGEGNAAAARGGGAERDEAGDRFANKTLAWAETAGILLPDPAWRRAATNYALTAFFIHYRIPCEWDGEGARWEERADLIARYMLLVAAGDEGIFDRVVEGEKPERKWARLQLSSRFLQGALRTERGPAPVPDVPDAALLAAISARWQELFEQHRRACHPAAAASFRVGLERLYAASLAEHRPGMASSLSTVGDSSAAAIEERFAAASPPIASRARALAGCALAGDRAAADELRVLLYLAEAASSIGAGLLFRTAALAAPASHVAPRSVALLDAAATLLDHHVRLSNDLSGFLATRGGDRDPKENACTVVVPASASGVAREAAIVRAVATCRRVMGWLEGEMGPRVAQVAAGWPSMGAILRRGMFVGRRVYEVGHYTTVSRAQMSAIFDEAEALR